jgi:hypothetical protein
MASLCCLFGGICLTQCSDSYVMLRYFDADASSVTIQFCKSAICADWNVKEREKFISGI